MNPTRGQRASHDSCVRSRVIPDVRPFLKVTHDRESKGNDKTISSNVGRSG